MLKNFIERHPVVKTVCREVFYRPSWYCGNNGDIERLFRWAEDPWNYTASMYERDRLRFILQQISQYPHERVLEVGCAEGIFTAELEKLAGEVVAIDVSPTALSRAKKRCSDATFVHSSLQDYTASRKFDLVICAETLYYMNDVEEAISKIGSLGKYCLVSYINREARTLDLFFNRMPLVRREKFEKRYWLWKRSMKMVVWESNGSTHG